MFVDTGSPIKRTSTAAPSTTTQRLLTTQKPPNPRKECGTALLPDNGQVRLDSESLKREALESHNHYRRYHGAKDLVWDDALAESAQQYADQCYFEHSNTPYGENLGLGQHNMTSLISQFYDEYRLYDFNYPVYSPETGHFTQVIWSGTDKIGCGVSLCAEGMKDRNGPIQNKLTKNWVCHYSPPGNFRGQFSYHVRCPTQ